ncbi:MAG: group III truncated hemoglobin [Chitinophagaceae bacterium]|nr:group III truncated hemoglobin [Chitinophagaceae bacterium]
MNGKTDVKNIEDIQLLVNTFYGKIRVDLLLGSIFNGVIKDRWPQHLEKMYRFWQTVLLEEHTYYGSPFPPHAQLPVEQKHFDRWLKLWNETIDEFFEGEKADEAKWRGNKMAAMFLSKIEYYRNSSSAPLL